MANRNSRRSRNRYSGANNSNKMKISAADKSALSGAVGGGEGEEEVRHLLRLLRPLKLAEAEVPVDPVVPVQLHLPHLSPL